MTDSMCKRTAKKRAKERDGYECRFCGLTNDQHIEEFGESIHAHHILKEREGGSDDPDNLITVCRECHNTLENTHAQGIAEIHRQDSAQAKELKEKINELEQQLEEAKDDDGKHGAFIWPDKSGVRVHVLIEGTFNPVSRVFTDKQKALEAYDDSDKATALRSHKVLCDTEIIESLQVRTYGDPQLHISDRDSSAYFEAEDAFESEEPEVGFMSNDVTRVKTELESLKQ